MMYQAILTCTFAPGLTCCRLCSSLSAYVQGCVCVCVVWCSIYSVYWQASVYYGTQRRMLGVLLHLPHSRETVSLAEPGGSSDNQSFCLHPLLEF